MGMVAPQQRIVSAFVVWFGNYGDISQHARDRGVCRQRVYRESAAVVASLEGVAVQQKLRELQQTIRHLQERIAELERRLARSVELDEDKQAEFASLGQANGVSLTILQLLLSVFLQDETPSVATLGRWTKAAGEKSGQLLPVLDELARARAEQAAADEIYVTDPVLMTVEPESLCWLGGRLTEHVSGEEWVREFRQLPALEQVTRDGGLGLQKGVELVNRERQEQGLPPVADQLDSFHALQGGQRGVRKAEGPAREAFAKAEAAQAEVERQNRQGQSLRASTAAACRHWAQATKAMDAWQQRDQAWQQTKQALQLFTPTGELNTRARAEAILAETLPHLPDKDFAKTKRMLHKAETLTFLDEVERKLQALPVPAEIRDAAVRSEGLRRRPQALQGDTPQAAALRGLALVCAVILAKAGEVGQQAVQGVRDIFRNTWRASSLVECINSVLRMQQSRHRRMTQGLLDLKRLYWNCHRFRRGRRRGQSPYELLGLPWPERLRWWDLLKLTREQLREKLSAPKRVA